MQSRCAKRRTCWTSVGKEHAMSTIHLSQTTTATPEQVLAGLTDFGPGRSEEHTSELQSQSNLVCRLLLEKKKTESHIPSPHLLEPLTRRDRFPHSFYDIGHQAHTCDPTRSIPASEDMSVVPDLSHALHPL